MGTPNTTAFKAAYPAFAAAGTPLLNEALATALLRTNANAYGDAYERAVYLRMADLLAKTPEGQKMRLVLVTGKSIYEADLKAMVRRATTGFGRNT